MAHTNLTALHHWKTYSTDPKDIQREIIDQLVEMYKEIFEAEPVIELQGIRICRKTNGGYSPVGKYHANWRTIAEHKPEKINVKFKIVSSQLPKGWNRGIN